MKNLKKVISALRQNKILNQQEKKFECTRKQTFTKLKYCNLFFSNDRVGNFILGKWIFFWLFIWRHKHDANHASTLCVRNFSFKLFFSISNFVRQSDNHIDCVSQFWNLKFKLSKWNASWLTDEKKTDNVRDKQHHIQPQSLHSSIKFRFYHV